MTTWPEAIGALSAAVGVVGAVGGLALRPLGTRLARIEQQTQLAADELPKLDKQLAKLTVATDTAGRRIDQLETRISDHLADHRAEHRRRNEQQAELLREALHHRLHPDHDEGHPHP
jgi:septal ring factor EnvC (AmiA/AmiB activator)